jgi:DNA-binding transcriptional MerR regulator
MSDGATVYECTSNDEVIDLLQGGQGVFGIAIGGVWREIEGTLAELPSERTVDDAAGITYRQRGYWARTGRVAPTVRGASGSGSPRPYPFRDILLLKVIKRLLDAGISLQQIRTAVQHLRQRGTDDLTRVTLMSDGASVYECTSNDEIIDLLQGGQGVFGIAIGGVWQEIEGTLAELPSERTADEPAASSADDELAARRAARQTG